MSIYVQISLSVRIPISIVTKCGLYLSSLKHVHAPCVQATSGTAYMGGGLREGMIPMQVKTGFHCMVVVVVVGNW